MWLCGHVAMWLTGYTFSILLLSNQELRRLALVVCHFQVSLFSDHILRATPSAAGPFWLPGLPFERLGVSILTFWGTILAPRAHPGEPFWRLGAKLEISFLLGRVSRSLFSSISTSTFRRWGLPNRGFRKESIAKIDFPLKSFFYEFRGRFLSFVGALGAVFSCFCCLENNFKIRTIFNEKRISSRRSGGGDLHGIWAFKTDNSIALMAESMTANC